MIRAPGAASGANDEKSTDYRSDSRSGGAEDEWEWAAVATGCLTPLIGWSTIAVEGGGAHSLGTRRALGPP